MCPIPPPNEKYSIIRKNKKLMKNKKGYENNGKLIKYIN